MNWLLKGHRRDPNHVLWSSDYHGMRHMRKLAKIGQRPARAKKRHVADP